MSKNVPDESGYYWMREKSGLIRMVYVDVFEETVVYIYNRRYISGVLYSWKEDDQKTLKGCKFSSELKPEGLW